MATIKTVTWSMDPHTEAKHIILRKYLDAWLPIMTTQYPKVLYIDGFAGPGEYSNDKEGSPIVAMNCVMNHKTKNKFEIVMAFIEKDKDRFDHLQEKLGKISIPENIKYQCFNGEFQTKMGEILDYIEQKKSTLAPAFVFIDPFGWNGIPLSIVQNIMKNRSCEVFITFMYEDINRFIGDEKLKEQFNSLFGSSEEEYGRIKNEQNPLARMHFLHDLYQKQLKDKANIKYVKSFLMKDIGNRPQYFLFFGTNNIKGLERMKEAMWKVDESGNFKFSDSTYNPDQPTLFETKPDLTVLEKELYQVTKGKMYSASAIRNYTIEHTAYLRKHCNQILRKWEKNDPALIQRLCDRCKRSNECKKHKSGFNDKCCLTTV